MALEDLSDEERLVVHECLVAAAHGPFFDDAEFQTIFGVARSDVAHVAAAWPGVDESSDAVRLAINNALINLTGYPHGLEEAWPVFISVPLEEVLRIYRKWRTTRLAGLR